LKDDPTKIQESAKENETDTTSDQQHTLESKKVANVESTLFTLDDTVHRYTRKGRSKLQQSYLGPAPRTNPYQPHFWFKGAQKQDKQIVN